MKLEKLVSTNVLRCVPNASELECTETFKALGNLIAGNAPTAGAGGDAQNPRSPNLLQPNKDPTNF